MEILAVIAAKGAALGKLVILILKIIFKIIASKNPKLMLAISGVLLVVLSGLKWFYDNGNVFDRWDYGNYWHDKNRNYWD